MTLSANVVERCSSYALGYKLTSAAGNYLPNRVAVFSPISTDKSSFSAWNIPVTITSNEQGLRPLRNNTALKLKNGVCILY